VRIVDSGGTNDDTAPQTNNPIILPSRVIEEQDVDRKRERRKPDYPLGYCWRCRKDKGGFVGDGSIGANEHGLSDFDYLELSSSGSG